MKKLWISLMTVMTTATLSALPLGNPWEASLHTDGLFLAGDCPSYWENGNWCDAWSVRLGFYGDFVFDRHMEIDRHENSSKIHRTHIETEAAYIALNFWDRFDLFGTLGVSNVKFASPDSSFGDPGTNNYVFLETDTDFSWSIGGRATLWECGCLGIGAEAQYFSARPNVNFTRTQILQYQDNTVILKYHEWQVGLGAAYRINIICAGTALIPYAGVKVGRANMTMDNFRVVSGFPDFDDETFYNLESERDWGYAVGVTLLGCNKISVTAEARFVDTRALYINSQFRF